MSHECFTRSFNETVRERFLRDESFRGALRATRRDLTPMVLRTQ